MISEKPVTLTIRFGLAECPLLKVSAVGGNGFTFIGFSFVHTCWNNYRHASELEDLIYGFYAVYGLKQFGQGTGFRVAFVYGWNFDFVYSIDIPVQPRKAIWRCLHL